MADKAQRSASAVDDKAPITMINNNPTKNGGRYVAAICGIKLFKSPSIGWIPANKANKPNIPKPMTIAP